MFVNHLCEAKGKQDGEANKAQESFAEFVIPSSDSPVAFDFLDEVFYPMVTSHASQGKTVDQVIVSVPVSAFSQANQAQFYVSMSRARASMHLFTDSKAALKEAVMRPSERLSPYEFISKSGNGRNLAAFATRSVREAVKQTEREMER